MTNSFYVVTGEVDNAISILREVAQWYPLYESMGFVKVDKFMLGESEFALFEKNVE